MDMSKQNYNKIFNNDFLQENYNFNQEKYINNESNEFKEDIKNMLSNSNARRIHIKQRKNNDKDYLIFDVDKNTFYRKMNLINIKENKKSYSPDININGRDDSPKTVVRVQRLPIKIKEDYII